MLVEKIDFEVEIIDAKGTIKKVTSDKLYEVLIKRNLKATRVPILLEQMTRLKEGLVVNGDDVMLKGMTLRRI